MRTTKTLMGKKAHEALRLGVNAIYEPVRVTFGPEGRNALLYRTMNRGNRITNDGVTVAECQEPDNIHVRMVAQTFKEACKRTAEKVGDGTTGTAIIGGHLFNELYPLLTESHNEFTLKGGKKGVITLKREILRAADEVKKMIKERAKKIETLDELEFIATVSVEDEKLGQIIAKMAWEVGIDGFIDVVEGYKGEIETEVIHGMRFPAKVAAPVFVNNPARFEMVVENSYVIVTNHVVETTDAIARAFQELTKHTSKVAIIAPSFTSNALINMVAAMKEGFSVMPVLAPALRTEQLEDLAVYFKAKFIDKNKGNKLSNVRLEDCGYVEKLVVKNSESREDAIATGGRGTAPQTTIGKENQDGSAAMEFVTPVQERVAMLKKQLEEIKEIPFKKLLERRIASMASSVGVIRVGDTTQASSLYRKLKIEDAVYASKSALRGGYVRGAGVCLKEIAESLPEGNILRKSLCAPFDQIQNSVDGGIEISPDVIDPAEAIYYAIEHATQVIANLITVESITAETEDVVPGASEGKIASAIMEYVITDKISKGQIKEGQEEAYRDSLGGLTEHEFGMMSQD